MSDDNDRFEQGIADHWDRERRELAAARRVVEAAREVRYRSRSGADAVRIDLDAFTGLWDKIEEYDAVVKETK